MAIAPAGPDRLTIADAGASIVPGPCVSLEPGLVDCPADLELLLVHAGDGDDRVRVSAAVRAAIRGGAGGDRLEGGPVANELHGDEGDDRLIGGVCADTLDGGPGADVMRGHPTGGTGGCADVVLYEERTQPVRVTLDGRANDGERGERDLVARDVEGVVGGRGDDLLVGNARTLNALFGGAGNDRLVGGGGKTDLLHGGAGNDVLLGGPSLGTLLGGPGADVLAGGGGADTLEGDRGADELRGGAGNDLLVGGAGRDRLFGGRGDDLLRSADGVRDLVAGGRGADRARADERDLVRGVERVARVVPRRRG